MDRQGRLHFPSKEGGTLRLKLYLDEKSEGTKFQNLWTDVPAINARAQERLGYPTQKPVALLERIVAASSNPGDVVLDPFCGCGTTVHAAEKLGRQWIGIDVTHLAIGLIEKRLRDAFPGVAFQTHGVPQDLAGARDLAARARRQELLLRVREVGAQPHRRPARQPRQEGRRPGHRRQPLLRQDPPRHRLGQGRRQRQRPDDPRPARRHRAREGRIGVFLTLTPPTRPMVTEAAAAGQFGGAASRRSRASRS